MLIKNSLRDLSEKIANIRFFQIFFNFQKNTVFIWAYYIGNLLYTMFIKILYQKILKII
jgi:hypothetical protein